jgi:hypothetical protein
LFFLAPHSSTIEGGAAFFLQQRRQQPSQQSQLHDFFFLLLILYYQILILIALHANKKGSFEKLFLCHMSAKTDRKVLGKRLQLLK